MKFLESVANFLKILLRMAICGAVVWVLFWIVNGVMWLSGIGGEAIISDVILHDAGTLAKIIIYLLGFEWFYGCAYFMALMEVTGDEGGDADLDDLLFGVLMTVLIIVVYDPRVAHHLPHFLESAVVWLQTTCNARLVGGISILNSDYSGAITDPVYFGLFDALVIMGGAFWLIVRFFLQKER